MYQVSSQLSKEKVTGEACTYDARCALAASRHQCRVMALRSWTIAAGTSRAHLTPRTTPKLASDSTATALPAGPLTPRQHTCMHFVFMRTRKGNFATVRTAPAVPVANAVAHAAPTVVAETLE
jgi:hypothetical protein